MWNVEPGTMCRKHLLGEHVEMHMFAGCIRKGKSLSGYIHKGLVDTRLIRRRHDKLAEEMERRGYRHYSPLEYEDRIHEGHVDMDGSERDLRARCAECREMQDRYVDG